MSDKVKEITDKMKAFREMQLLPLQKDLSFENWLENFREQEEREIAAHILQHFLYFSDDLINQMLRTVVGRCGYFLYFITHNLLELRSIIKIIKLTE